MLTHLPIITKQEPVDEPKSPVPRERGRPDLVVISSSGKIVPDTLRGDSVINTLSTYSYSTLSSSDIIGNTSTVEVISKFTV